MNELTAFEHALLEQFRILADRFDQSQRASEELSSKLLKWLRATSMRQEQIEERLTKIEATQNSSTSNLAKQVNALLATRELVHERERQERSLHRGPSLGL